MIRAQNKPERPCACDATLDTSFIKIGSEEIYAIGAAQIVRPVPVEVPQARPGRRIDDGADPEVILNVSLVLERNTMSINKRQVGNDGLKFVSQGNRFGRPLPEKFGKPLESLATLFLDMGRRRIAPKKSVIAVRARG